MFQIDGEVCDYDPQKTVRSLRDLETNLTVVVSTTLHVLSYHIVLIYFVFFCRDQHRMSYLNELHVCLNITRLAR